MKYQNSATNYSHRYRYLNFGCGRQSTPSIPCIPWSKTLFGRPLYKSAPCIFLRVYQSVFFVGWSIRHWIACSTSSGSTQVLQQSPQGRWLATASTGFGNVAKMPPSSSFSQATAMTAATSGRRTSATALRPPLANTQRMPYFSVRSRI